MRARTTASTSRAVHADDLRPGRADAVSTVTASTTASTSPGSAAGGSYPTTSCCTTADRAPLPSARRPVRRATVVKPARLGTRQSPARTVTFTPGRRDRSGPARACRVRPPRAGRRARPTCARRGGGHRTAAPAPTVGEQVAEVGRPCRRPEGLVTPAPPPSCARRLVRSARARAAGAAALRARAATASCRVSVSGLATACEQGRVVVVRGAVDERRSTDPCLQLRQQAAAGRRRAPRSTSPVEAVQVAGGRRPPLVQPGLTTACSGSW